MIFYKKLKFWRFDNVLRNVWPYFAAQAETISASGQKSNTYCRIHWPQFDSRVADTACTAFTNICIKNMMMMITMITSSDEYQVTVRSLVAIVYIRQLESVDCCFTRPAVTSRPLTSSHKMVSRMHLLHYTTCLPNLNVLCEFCHYL